MPSRTIAIGDIHGCSATLIALLHAIGPGPHDLIVTLGDYINRGADTRGVLDRLIERIYLLRCQLIHGAATCGGKLNRTALRRSTKMLSHLMPAVLLVIIDHGADEDWGLLCYPPMESRFVPSANGRFVPSKPR